MIITLYAEDCLLDPGILYQEIDMFQAELEYNGFYSELKCVILSTELTKCS